jgi:hypothetical protein
MLSQRKKLLAYQQLGNRQSIFQRLLYNDRFACLTKLPMQSVNVIAWRHCPRDKRCCFCALRGSKVSILTCASKLKSDGQLWSCLPTVWVPYEKQCCLKLYAWQTLTIGLPVENIGTFKVVRVHYFDQIESKESLIGRVTYAVLSPWNGNHCSILFNYCSSRLWRQSEAKHWTSVPSNQITRIRNQIMDETCCVSKSGGEIW